MPGNSYGAVYDPVRQLLVVTADPNLGDLEPQRNWEWSYSTGVWTERNYAFGGQRSVYHPPSGNILIADDLPTAPNTPTSAVTRIYSYNGTTWTEMPTGGLAPPLGVYQENDRYLVYDSQRERIVAVDSNSSYDFDGSKWRVKGPAFNYPNGPGQVDGLLPRRAFGVAYDKRRGVVVRYGGGINIGASPNFYYVPQNETFELKRTAGSGIVLVNPNISISDPLLRCVGEDLVLHFLVSIGNGVNSTAGITYQWFKDGSPTTCGSGTAPPGRVSSHPPTCASSSRARAATPSTIRYAAASACRSTVPMSSLPRVPAPQPCFGGTARASSGETPT